MVHSSSVRPPSDGAVRDEHEEQERGSELSQQAPLHLRLHPRIRGAGSGSGFLEHRKIQDRPASGRRRGAPNRGRQPHPRQRGEKGSQAHRPHGPGRVRDGMEQGGHRRHQREHRLRRRLGDDRPPRLRDPDGKHAEEGPPVGPGQDLRVHSLRRGARTLHLRHRRGRLPRRPRVPSVSTTPSPATRGSR